MAFYNFDPASSFAGLSKKVNNMFNEFEKGISFEIGGYAPRVDIRENETNVYLFAEMPGVKKEDLKVSINEENVLVIKGEKKQPEPYKEEGMVEIKNERNFGQFARSFLLPDMIISDSIEASFEDGILKIMLTKKEPAKPKEINVDIK